MKCNIPTTFVMLAAMLMAVSATTAETPPDSRELTDLRQRAMESDVASARLAMRRLSEIGTPDAADVAAEVLRERVLSQKTYPAEFLVANVQFDTIPEDSDLFVVLSQIQRGHRDKFDVFGNRIVDPSAHRDETQFFWGDRLAAAGVLGRAGHDTVGFLLAAHDDTGFLLGRDTVRSAVLAALVQSRTEAAAKTVAELISDRWAFDLVDSIGGMRSIGNPYSIVVLREIMKDEVWRTIDDVESMDYVHAMTLLRVIADFGDLDDLQMLQQRLAIDDQDRWPANHEFHADVDTVRKKILERQEPNAEHR